MFFMAIYSSRVIKVPIFLDFCFIEVSVQRQYVGGPSSWISSICVPLLHQHPIGLFGLRLGYGLPPDPHRDAAFVIACVLSTSNKTK